MTQTAQEKINFASRACDRVNDEWKKAFSTLSKPVSVNGYGIFHDQAEIKANLLSARGAIDAALIELEGADFPSSADYNKV